MEFFEPISEKDALSFSDVVIVVVVEEFELELAVLAVCVEMDSEEFVVLFCDPFLPVSSPNL